MSLPTVKVFSSVSYPVSYYFIYLVPKSLLTIRHCSFHLSEFFMFYLFFSRNFITFVISQSFLEITFISFWILYFLVLFLNWGHSWRQACYPLCWYFFKYLNLQYRAYSILLHITYNCCENFPLSSMQCLI